MRKRIRESLSAKVFLWVFTALTLCSIGIYAVVMLIIPARYRLVSGDRLSDNVNAFIRELEASDYASAKDKIYNFCIENNTVATLMDDTRTLTFGAMDPGEGDMATSSYTENIHFKDSATPYMLVLTSISKTEDDITAIFLKILPGAAAVIFLISAFSAWICSRVIVVPIAKISGISKRMTALDMTWQCDVDRPDEIGVLASSLNTMARRLAASMEAQALAQRQLETANSQLAQTNDQLETANVRLAEDVRKFELLEQQRRSFFTAVSHELKTPLTILMGQLENMVLGLGDYKNHDKYLPQALDAAENIEHLVRELLDIARMEAMDLEETMTATVLWPLAEQCVSDILPLAGEKKIRIHKALQAGMTDDFIISANQNLFRKVLSNLVGNAVRHSPEGAEVFVRLICGSQGPALEVENTGAFIAREDMEQLFAPFYRADRSRSRATGGSGLGLYIVKTILDLHHMSCTIKNTCRGVLVTVFLEPQVASTPVIPQER